MFDNIGGKLKVFAKVLCWIGIISSCICAIVLWSINSRYQPTAGAGFLVLIFGCLGSWIGSFFTYGFGELIDELSANRQASQRSVQLLEKLLASQQTVSLSVQRDSASSLQTAAASAENTSAKRPQTNITTAKLDVDYHQAQKASNDIGTKTFAGCSCKPIAVSDNEIRCRFCSTVQPKDRKVCLFCEAKFLD